MFKKTLVVMMVLAFALTACAPARSQKQFAPESLPSEMFAGAPPAADVYQEAEGYRTVEEQAVANSQVENPVERMVIRNANLSIVVRDPAEAMDEIISMAEEMGGFVVTSNLYQRRLDNGNLVLEGNVTVRVPALDLNEALSRIKGLVENPQTDVLSENISGQDVTAEYTDLKSRLRNLEDAAEQLRKIMDTATKTEDVLRVLNELRSVTEQIEVLKGQIKYYEESAAMSAISVNIQAQETVAPISVGGWKPEGVARDAIQALINAYQTIASGVIWAVLFCLPIALPIGLVVFFIVRGFLRWRKRRKTIMPATAAEKSE
ncbi:MAG: hypothetical protein KatS3mg047_1414 [Bellilinea sp.]|nr:MAG: hypothetical protein KatS3mg047_1414 [Bellilinea sp.]